MLHDSCSIPPTQLKKSATAGSVWSCRHVYRAESFQREQTLRRARGWWETVPGTGLWNAGSQMLLACGHQSGADVTRFQMPTLWSEGSAHKRACLWVDVWIFITRGNNNESSDVGSSFCPLRSHDGGLGFCLWVGEYIFALWKPGDTWIVLVLHLSSECKLQRRNPQWCFPWRIIPDLWFLFSSLHLARMS